MNNSPHRFLAQSRKIKNQEDRELVRRNFLSNATSANPKLAESAIAGLLPEPDSKTP